MKAGSAAIAGKKSSALEELTCLPRRGENPYIREWKERGGKVFGFVCSYVPEEVLYADPVDILPIRMGAAGCEATDEADVCLPKFMCSFSKCLLQLGLTGEYGFLDGMVVTNACDQIRRTYEYWRDEVKLPFITMVAVPHCMDGKERAEWYYSEVKKLVDDVGTRYGFLPSEESLRKSIRTYNRYRELMLELYRLRMADDPGLTGSEAMKIAQAGSSMPKDVFNEKLEEALVEIQRQPGIKNARARIMIAGSYLDDTFLIDIVESAGAVVVTDNLCTGRRYVEGMVDEKAEPVAAIAERYFRKMSCPRMIGSFRERVEFTRRLATEAKVDGVIFQRLPFCDNHSVENLMESQVLQKAGIPTIDLEREYIAADEGRMKTRVQAFLEKIGK